MYDHSELLHDTPVRRSALRSGHLDGDARPLPGLTRSRPRVPAVVLTVIAAAFGGGWLS